ncbi:hypothetical protein BN1221_03116 [Brenneria goodwinii]|uniref:Uncharacterized protein n=1 Tax=Brenneria goodwinii TaxID=1109412 RepID=A0A0G4JXP2_9GAMM|nr:hypothetical protein BN1221_03116 [Brenneria goodwinii]
MHGRLAENDFRKSDGDMKTPVRGSSGYSQRGKYILRCA